jgi:hypothetical protein
MVARQNVLYVSLILALNYCAGHQGTKQHTAVLVLIHCYVSYKYASISLNAAFLVFQKHSSQILIE